MDADRPLDSGPLTRRPHDAVEVRAGERQPVRPGSAKNLLEAVAQAEAAIARNRDVYPLHASLLGDFSAVMVEQARSAIGRSEALVKEALRSNLDRGEN